MCHDLLCDSSLAQHLRSLRVCELPDYPTEAHLGEKAADNAEHPRDQNLVEVCACAPVIIRIESVIDHHADCIQTE